MTAPPLRPLFELNRVYKDFGRLGGLLRGESTFVRAVEDVSLRIQQGEALGIVGESGSGKTTLGRLLTGFEEPTSGTVEFEGADIRRLRGKDLLRFRSRVQMVFQNPFSSLNPRRSVRDAISAGLLLHNIVAKREIDERLTVLLDRVGLHKSMLDRYPHQFSGGQRQRIVIARALSVEPEVLIADEPVSALDVSVQAQVLNLLKALQREMSLSVLLITHDLRVVNFFSDRIGVMYLGRLIELGPRPAIVSSSRHPYTRMLLIAASTQAESKETDSERRIVQGELDTDESVRKGCVFSPRCWLRERLGRPERCTEEVPPLRPVAGDGHLAACHFAEEIDEAASVLEAEPVASETR